MNTILNGNNIPVLTWNHFNVNYKQIQLYNRPDDKNNPVITGDSTGMHIENKTSLDNFLISGNDAKTASYIIANASITKTITVNKNNSVETPLIFDMTLKDNDKLTALFDIILEENSHANIIVSISSAANAAGQYTDLIRIHAKKNSSLTFTCLQLLGENFLAFNNAIAYVENDAKVTIHHMPLGGKTALASALTDLHGYKAASEIYADYIGHNRQDIDLNYVTRHYGKKGLSEIKMTGLLLNDSKKTARGTLDFHHGCKGSSGNESENVLLLSKTAKNKSVPLMLCDEDDVVGNHGAAIGALDEEHLFYLQSRGIDETSARQIFLDSAIARLKNLLPQNLAAKIDTYDKEVLCNESL